MQHFNTKTTTSRGVGAKLEDFIVKGMRGESRQQRPSFYNEQHE